MLIWQMDARGHVAVDIQNASSAAVDVVEAITNTPRAEPCESLIDKHW